LSWSLWLGVRNQNFRSKILYVSSARYRKSGSWSGKVNKYIVANFKVWSHNVCGGKPKLHFAMESRCWGWGLRIETETCSSRSDMTAVDSEMLTRGNKTVQNGSIKWNVHANGAVYCYQRQRAAQYKDVTHLAAFWITSPLLTLLRCSFLGPADKQIVIECQSKPFQSVLLATV
jgi:hypothetical protein